MTPDEWFAKYGTYEGWAKAYGSSGTPADEGSTTEPDPTTEETNR